MKILWLSHFVPYPPIGGCFQRSYNLIREAASKNEIYLIALRNKEMTHPDCDLNTAEKELKKICREVIFVDISSNNSKLGFYAAALKSLFTTDPMSVNIFKSREMHYAIKKLSRKVRFQLVHFDTISMAEYIDDFENVPKMMNHHGVESFMIRRRAENDSNIMNKLYLMLEGYKLEKYEIKYCPQFKVNLTVSDLDKKMLERITKVNNFEVIENGVDVDYFHAVFENVKNKNIIFAGRLDQYSNRESLLHFMESVWPLLKNKYPDLRFTIIGNNPPSKLVEMARGDENIDLLGYVKDVRPHFAKAAISVCPIRDGGGTRIKILDALAMGMPIVSTTIGCEGIEIHPETDILIADTPGEFVEKVDRIFTDPDAGRKLSENARRTAEEKYSWKALGVKLNEIYSRYE